MIERLRYDPRRLVVVAALLVGLVILASVVALVVRLTGNGDASARAQSAPYLATSAAAHPPALVTSSPARYATDAASWDAMPAAPPATSRAFPAVAAAADRDPTAFATAFVTELFTRDYVTSTRAQLISWAQYEDSPLQSARYPRPDWTKVLVDSLTDLSWDQADDTPIPADGPWLALRSEHARQSVGNIRVTLDTAWEQRIADGYRPPDPMATERDVTLTVTQSASVSGRISTTRFAVSIDVQLGTSARGEGYGVAATNNYVSKQVS